MNIFFEKLNRYFQNVLYENTAANTAKYLSISIHYLARILIRWAWRIPKISSLKSTQFHLCAMPLENTLLTENMNKIKQKTLYLYTQEHIHAHLCIPIYVFI